MEVVLLERVAHLGLIGDVVKVKDGFARNFLIPQKKALRATKENLEYFAQQKAQIEAANLKKKKEAEAVALRMGNLCVNIIRQAGESGRLFGSVRNSDIAKAITQSGFSVGRSQVSIELPIKDLGIHTVKLTLHPEVNVDVRVNVAQSEEEAAAQLAMKSSEGKTEEESHDRGAKEKRKKPSKKKETVEVEVEGEEQA